MPAREGTPVLARSEIVAPRANARGALEVWTADQAQRALDGLLGAIARGDLPVAVRPEVAARMLDVSVKTLDRLGVPSVKLGHRTRRYPVRQLLSFLAERVE